MYGTIAICLAVLLTGSADSKSKLHFNATHSHQSAVPSKNRLKQNRASSQRCPCGKKLERHSKVEPVKIKVRGAAPLDYRFIEDTSALDKAYAIATSSAMSMAKWGPKDVALTELLRLRAGKHPQATDSGQNETILHLLLDMNRDLDAIRELEEYELPTDGEHYFALYLYLTGKAGRFERAVFDRCAARQHRFGSSESGWQTAEWPTKTPNCKTAVLVGALEISYLVGSWDVAHRALTDAQDLLPFQPLVVSELASRWAAKGSVAYAKELLEGGILKSTGKFKSYLTTVKNRLPSG